MTLPVLSLLVSLTLMLHSFTIMDVGSFLPVAFAEATDKTPESARGKEGDKRIEISKVPVAHALVMGNRKAPKKVIIFTDPDCPYCGKLHWEVKKILEKRSDVVFYVKLYPLKIHKNSYWKSKSIICNKSLRLLEDNFEKKVIPDTDCASKEIEQTIRLAESLGITGTPSLILPDGRIHFGAMSAEQLLQLIDESQ